MAEEKSQDSSGVSSRRPPVTMNMMAETLLPEFFQRAYKIYGQDAKDKGNFYISDGNLFGLKMAVLPERDTFVFSTYCPANPGDCAKLRRLHREGVFKTYDCSLCSIQEPNNAILVSNEQNQFYVDNEAASVQLNQEWVGVGGVRFVVSGTTPQYFYGHLLLTASNHLPMFAAFTDTRVLQSILLFMKEGSKTNKYLYSYMNGNSGSDPWHFHAHLASGIEDPFLQRCIEEFELKDGIMPVERGIVRAAVFCHNDLGVLTNLVNNNMTNIMSLKDKGALITSNFFFADEKFFVVVYVSRGERTAVYENPVTRQKCTFVLILSSCELFPASCFQAPTNSQQLEHFLAWVKETFGGIYVSPNKWGLVANPEPTDKWSRALKAIIATDSKEIIKDPRVDPLYIWVERRRVDALHGLRSGDPAKVEEAKTNMRTLGRHALKWCVDTDCFVDPTKCDADQHSKFKYMLGIAFNNVDNALIENPDGSVVKLLINSEFARLRNLNKEGVITTDYMYFQGSYIQHVIKRTVNDLLTVTQGEGRLGGVGPWMEKGEILRWFAHQYRPIGEQSASGTNFTTQVKFPISGRDCRTAKNPVPCNEVDMVMKVMDTRSAPRYTGPDCQVLRAPPPGASPTVLPAGWTFEDNDKKKEFLHEFLVSLIVNDIREVIPNFSLCYGGFFCNSSDTGPNRPFASLCDKGVGKNNSYLLTELVKDSETLGRAIRRHQGVPVAAEAEELLDGITQIMAALSYGWELKHFTHYDLHQDNVMRYNILSTDFKKLFRGVDIPTPSKVLFRYWGGPEILGPSSVHRGKSGSILIPATHLYLIIDYGNSHVDGIPENATYERCDRASVGMTPTQSKSYYDVFTFCIATFMMILSTGKSRLLISTTTGELRGNLAIFYVEFFKCYQVVWVDRDWQGVMRGAFQAARAGQSLPVYLMSVIAPKYRPAHPHPHYLSPKFKKTDLPQYFSSPGLVLNWLMDNVYSPQNLWQYLTHKDAIVFNWGQLPAHKRMGIQTPPKVEEFIDEKISSKKQLVHVTKDFMDRYTKHKQEQREKERGDDPMDIDDDL
jgi:hypothetical protein